MTWKKRIAKKILRDELLESIVLFSLLTIICVFFTFFSFDYKNISASYPDKDDLPSELTFVLEQFGLVGIAKQSYFFGFVFSSLCFLILLIFFTYLSIERNKHDIFKFQLSGKYRYGFHFHFIIESVLLLFITILSWIMTLILLNIINHFLYPDVSLLVFPPIILLITSILCIAGMIIRLIAYKIYFNEKRLDAYYRELL